MAPFVDRLRQANEATPSGAVLYRIPLLSRHEDGRRRQLVNVATAPLLTPDGSTSGMMVIVEDITERVRLEEQLQISEKMASVGLLAAGVAHEVNTPLTAISSFTQMLLEGADPEDSKTQVLEKIERQTFRAAKIVNGLLNLARPGRPGCRRSGGSQRGRQRRAGVVGAPAEGEQRQGAPRAGHHTGSRAGCGVQVAAGVPEPVSQCA